MFGEVHTECGFFLTFIFSTVTNICLESTEVETVHRACIEYRIYSAMHRNTKKWLHLELGSYSGLNYDLFANIKLRAWTYAKYSSFVSNTREP